MLIVALIGAIGVLVAALITGGSTGVAAVISHGSNGTAPTPSQATAPAHPEVSGDMPEPNCPTCISGGKTFPEQAGGGSEKHTFRDPRSFAGLGPSVQPGQRVEVVCRFLDPNAPVSVKPGWWYLIDSPPWNRQYYTVANSYLNGDPPQGPYINAVDKGVPECTVRS
jgi:hypothetical protein